jgi:hypothetical protein
MSSKILFSSLDLNGDKSREIVLWELMRYWLRDRFLVRGEMEV